MEQLRERFLRTYANTPIGLRDDIVVVHEKTGPMTWFTAYLEVKNKTKLSIEILSELAELKLI